MQKSLFSADGIMDFTPFLTKTSYELATAKKNPLLNSHSEDLLMNIVVLVCNSLYLNNILLLFMVSLSQLIHRVCPAFRTGNGV